MENLTLIGLITLAFTLAMRELFTWFRQKSLQNTEARLASIESQVKPIRDKVDQLHTWHNRMDEDGVPVWYVRASLENVVKQNADAVTVLAQQSQLTTQVLQEIGNSQKEILTEIRRLHTVPTQLLHLEK